MREIKFRGRDTDGNWHYGDLLRYVNNSYDMIIPVGYANSDNLYDDVVCVDYDTVGQFTGLHDDDGREIYEGDIIKVRTQNPYWRFRRNYVVEWGTDGWLLDGDSLYSWFSLHTLEVIGNVHDNPDLLEVEHD